MSRRPNPFDPVFHAIREIVRETARRLGKEARLHVSARGGDAAANGLDLARIQEALVQALQNALDHGIEPASIRKKAGKNAIGQIWLEVDVEGDDTVIRVRDDGAGVDLAAVSRKAVGLGLIDSADKLATADSLALLFQPGFSTKKTVTEVSGRGIGLDIVRAVVDSLSGTVEIDTTRGEGTALTLRFPRKPSALAA